MKRLISLALAVLMVCAAISAVAETVDTYASASLTKSFVEGDELVTLADTLSKSCADIATLAQTKAEGYQKMYGKHVNVFSVNPDGSIGLSTIGYWRYMNNHEGGADQVVIQLTEGQNALNLYNAGVGAGSTLMVKLDDGFTYLLHLRITDIHVQEFTQEAYDAGEFASGYSGADRQARSFYFTFDVLSIEKTNQIL